MLLHVGSIGDMKQGMHIQIEMESESGNIVCAEKCSGQRCSFRSIGTGGFACLGLSLINQGCYMISVQIVKKSCDFLTALTHTITP